MVELAIIVVSIVFFVLGGVMSVRPQWYIRFAQWQMKVIWRAEFKVTKMTMKRIRVMGIAFLVLGAWVLYRHLVLGLN